MRAQPISLQHRYLGRTGAARDVRPCQKDDLCPAPSGANSRTERCTMRCIAPIADWRGTCIPTPQATPIRSAHSPGRTARCVPPWTMTGGLPRPALGAGRRPTERPKQCARAAPGARRGASRASGYLANPGLPAATAGGVPYRGVVAARLSVVVVAYDMARELPRTLRSILGAPSFDPNETEVIVVDN